MKKLLMRMFLLGLFPIALCTVILFFTIDIIMGGTVALLNSIRECIQDYMETINDEMIRFGRLW